VKNRLKWLLALVGTAAAIVVAILLRDRAMFLSLRRKQRDQRAKRLRSKQQTHQAKMREQQNTQRSAAHYAAAQKAGLKALELETKIDAADKEMAKDVELSERVRRFNARFGSGS